MAGAKGGGLPRSTILAASVSIGLIGVFAYFVVTWGNRRTEAATLRDEIAAIDTTLEEKGAELAPQRRQLETLQSQTDLFARGKMCVFNPSSSERVTIQHLAVVYMDEGGQFQSFNSDSAGGLTWTMDPGHRENLSRMDSGWDGSVTYYAMWLRVGTREFPIAAPWPLDPEHCVRLPS
jgi:hypothetical protein